MLHVFHKKNVEKKLNMRNVQDKTKGNLFFSSLFFSTLTTKYKIETKHNRT